MAALPVEVSEFEAFLSRSGLSRTRFDRYPESFGNVIIEYSDGRLGVQLICDRSIWCVTACDVAGRPGEWYDAALLRDLMKGPGDDEPSLGKQIGIMEGSWQDIRRSFSPKHRDDTHARLDQLRKARARRLFPGLSP